MFIKMKLILENLEIIKIEDLERFIMELPKKKDTEEGITSKVYVSFCSTTFFFSVKESVNQRRIFK